MPKKILEQILDEEPHENWNYNEFIGLLLVYAGWSDGDFSEDEIEYVISKVGLENYSKAVEYLKETDDLDQVTMLMILFEHYASNQQRKELIFSTLKEMILADGKIDISEQNLLDSYKFLFE